MYTRMHSDRRPRRRRRLQSVLSSLVRLEAPCLLLGRKKHNELFCADYMLGSMHEKTGTPTRRAEARILPTPEKYFRPAFSSRSLRGGAKEVKAATEEGLTNTEGAARSLALVAPQLRGASVSEGRAYLKKSRRAALTASKHEHSHPLPHP
jgi:hypothetical protein